MILTSRNGGHHDLKFWKRGKCHFLLSEYFSLSLFSPLSLKITTYIEFQGSLKNQAKRSQPFGMEESPSYIHTRRYKIKRSKALVNKKTTWHINKCGAQNWKDHIGYSGLLAIGAIPKHLRVSTALCLK